MKINGFISSVNINNYKQLMSSSHSLPIKAIITCDDLYKKEDPYKYFTDIGYDHFELFDQDKLYTDCAFYKTYSNESRQYRFVNYYIKNSKEFDKENTDLKSYDHYIVAEEILSQDTITRFKYQCQCHNCSLYWFDFWTRRIHPVGAGCFLSGSPSTRVLNLTRKRIQEIEQTNKLYEMMSERMHFER